MNEPFLAELWDGYLYVLGQLKSLGGDVLSEGTTPAGLSCALFSSPYDEWEECARLYWATHNYKVPCPWKRKTCRNLHA